MIYIADEVIAAIDATSLAAFLALRRASWGLGCVWFVCTSLCVCLSVCLCVLCMCL